ncbi:GntR family transcriptional regulator [Alkalicoccobacillus porphyridii]|uniref:GntR family transcriptional regulator n=1 Tax=Alkalicoccobacillus porphyridii TaxID=2597270 RepID=A0A553ZZ15_9BACI|nr:GntR family transcriptional regulator [Alkalicoccobacillus porphyridii]TSB46645.1 GntR family transcriptional regulator [Alkalicoccobacillus porphyridii]
MSPTYQNKPSAVSSRVHVYHTLRESITSLNLKPGAAISEKEIADELHVSRTPVREAFLQLAQEQLLEIKPQRGSFITLIDLEQVENARFIREHLELGIVKLACDQATSEDLDEMDTNLILQERMMTKQNYDRLFQLDGEFHRLIAASCGKQQVSDMIFHMNVQLERLRMLSLSSNLNWYEILSQHQQIHNAIKNRDHNKAEALMKEHLRMITVDQVELKEQFPMYFK